MIKDLYTRLKLFLFKPPITNTLVSIIVPVYNVEKHLRKTVAKILKQTHSNLEIIFVDDGSIDNSYEILTEFKQRDSRINVIQQANQGPGAARNTGLKRAKGDYILFHDSDDYLHPKAVKRLLTLIIKTQSQAVSGISFVQTKKLTRRYSRYQKWDFNLCFHNDDKKAKEYSSSVSVCNKLFLREFLLQHQLFFMEGIYFEDSEFWARTMYHIQNFTQSPYLISLYRYNPNSFTRKIKLDIMMSSLFKISQQLNLFHQKNQSSSFIQNMNYVILNNPFRFMLKQIIISSQPHEFLDEARRWLADIPQEHLIAFFYEKNKRLALIFLSVKWGYFDWAKRLYQYSNRKKPINHLKRLEYQNTNEFHDQFCNSFLKYL